MMEAIKVFIVAGGKGKRLFPRTLGIFPKSLIPLSEKPVIYYQLKVYEQFDIDDVTISFNEQWQIDLFKKYVELGLVPNLSYQYHLRPYIPEQHHFDSLKDFLTDIPKGKTTIVFSAGDIVFTPAFFSNLLRRCTQNKSSILVKDKPDKAIKNRILTKDDLIYAIDPNKFASWTLNCFFLVESSSIENLREASLKQSHRTLEFVKHCLSGNKKVFAIWPNKNEFLNINSEKDFRDAVSLVKS